MKKALITGIGGQDGSYLTSYLSANNYEVFGTTSKGGSTNVNATVLDADICDFEAASNLIRRLLPDEIYHCAAIFRSSEDNRDDDFRFFSDSFRVNVGSTLNILEATHRHSPATKIFFASSAQIFGDSAPRPQNEETPKNPNNVYSITKLTATNLCHLYRNTRNAFVSVGILYNHESPLRGDGFVSKKVAKAAVEILQGKSKKLVIGDLEAEVDWGFAPDYVEAMTKILQLDHPDDFIISSGETHTVEEFVEVAFSHLGLDWHRYVEVNSTLVQKKSRNTLFGDNSKIRSLTGWKPTKSFEEIVEHMVDHELGHPEKTEKVTRTLSR